MSEPNEPTQPPMQFLQSQADCALLGQLLHIATTDPLRGGLLPIAGEGSPAVAEVAIVFSKRLGKIAPSLPSNEG